LLIDHFWLLSLLLNLFFLLTSHFVVVIQLFSTDKSFLTIHIVVHLLLLLVKTDFWFLLLHNVFFIVSSFIFWSYMYRRRNMYYLNKAKLKLMVFFISKVVKCENFCRVSSIIQSLLDTIISPTVHLIKVADCTKCS
jgi:hypothetical protein